MITNYSGLMESLESPYFKEPKDINKKRSPLNEDSSVAVSVHLKSISERSSYGKSFNTSNPKSSNKKKSSMIEDQILEEVEMQQNPSFKNLNQPLFLNDDAEDKLDSVNPFGDNEEPRIIKNDSKFTESIVDGSELIFDGELNKSENMAHV